MTDNQDIRLVVTDLDGTLLDPNREISDRAVKTIARLGERGVLFTFITGRPPYAIQQFAERVPLTAPVVCCNGAVIEHQGKVLLKRSFPLAPLQPLMEQAAALGLTVLLYAGGTEYTLSPTEWTSVREARGQKFPIWHFSEHLKSVAEKVNIMSGEGTAAFATLIPQICALNEEYSIALYGESGCEIVAPEVDKAAGLADLCRLCGVTQQQVLAIGDNENDHAMLRAAGIGVAVANATPATKVQADYCCSAAYTDGVVEAIGKFVLGEAL